MAEDHKQGEGCTGECTVPCEEATCVYCGCTDSKACEGGCSWAEVDYKKGEGVCSKCAEKGSLHEAENESSVFKEQLKKLLEKRTEKEVLLEKYNNLYAEFENKNKELLDKIERTKEEIFHTENSLRVFAIERYVKTQKKVFDGGVKIRIMEKVLYKEDEAFEWAKEHRLALSLDKKAFEKIAKTTPLLFVDYRKEPMATIPQKIEVGK